MDDVRVRARVRVRVGVGIGVGVAVGVRVADHRVPAVAVTNVEVDTVVKDVWQLAARVAGVLHHAVRDHMLHARGRCPEGVAVPGGAWGYCQG